MKILFVSSINQMLFLFLNKLQKSYLHRIIIRFPESFRHFNLLTFNLIRFFLLLAILLSCNEKAEQATVTSNQEKDSIELTLLNSDEIISDLTSSSLDLKNAAISYKMLVLTDSVRKQLNRQFPDSNLIILCAINRIDPDRLHRADSLIVPDTIYHDLNVYSPYPRKLAIADSIDKLILISYKYQAFALYQDGILDRWGPVSMGAKSSLTPTGLFHTNWKSKRQISTDNSSWILPWYFNLVNNTGVSLHQFELPGFPASHSCVRLRLSDAEYIYYFAEQWKLDNKGWNVVVEGTPVIIFGEYPFGKPRPWFEPAISQSTELLQEDSLTRIIEAYLSQIIEEQEERKLYFKELKSDSIQ